MVDAAASGCQTESSDRWRGTPFTLQVSRGKPLNSEVTWKVVWRGSKLLRQPFHSAEMTRVFPGTRQNFRAVWQGLKWGMRRKRDSTLWRSIVHCVINNFITEIFNWLTAPSMNVINDWMATNPLQLNSAKTDVLIIAQDASASNVAGRSGSDSANMRPKLRNLGVIFDHAMHFYDHITSVTCSCFFHLRNISKLRSILTYSELEMIIHAFALHSLITVILSSLVSTKLD